MTHWMTRCGFTNAAFRSGQAVVPQLGRAKVQVMREATSTKRLNRKAVIHFWRQEADCQSPRGRRDLVEDSFTRLGLKHGAAGQFPVGARNSRPWRGP